MSSVVTIVGPLLLLALLGFTCARQQVLSRDQVMGLGRFLVAVAIPAVLVLSLSRLDIDQVFGSRFIVAYVLVGLCLLVPFWWLARRMLGVDAVATTTMALGVAIPNNIILGYPLSRQMFGDASVPMFVAVVLVENAIYLPAAYLLYEGASHAGRISGKALVTITAKVLINPITLSVIVGLLLALLGIELPSLVARTLELLGSAVTGMALFYVGASFASARLGDTNLRVGASVAARLVIAPMLAVAVALVMPGLTDMERTLLVLFCAPPCFSILPAIAAPYGAGGLGASIQVLGTALSVFSLPLVLFFLT